MTDIQRGGHPTCPECGRNAVGAEYTDPPHFYCVNGHRWEGPALRVHTGEEARRRKRRRDVVNLWRLAAQIVAESDPESVDRELAAIADRLWERVLTEEERQAIREEPGPTCEWCGRPCRPGWAKCAEGDGCSR